MSLVLSPADLAAIGEWLVDCDTGLSSEAIVAWALGARSGWLASPRDPADLGRCLRLLDRVPALRAHLPGMVEISPVWARLIAAWSDLEALMTDEVGINWSKGRSAPRTYNAMLAVRDGVAA